MFSLLVIVPGDLIVPLPMMTVRISGGREGGRERGEREKRGRERCTCNDQKNHLFITEELSAPRELTEEPMTPETTVSSLYIYISIFIFFF